MISQTLQKLVNIGFVFFPDRPYTQKAAQMGMGKGRRSTRILFEVLPGRIIFEDGIEESVAREDIKQEASFLLKQE